MIKLLKISNLMFRPLELADYHKDYLSLLAQLTSVEPLTFEQFADFVQQLNANHQIWVLEQNQKIVASGTLYKESKLTHGLTKYAHLEEIVVDANLRGQGLGAQLINWLVKQSSDCSKVVLNCRPALANFYSQNGFTPAGLFLSKSL